MTERNRLAGASAVALAAAALAGAPAVAQVAGVNPTATSEAQAPAPAAQPPVPNSQSQSIAAAAGSPPADQSGTQDARDIVVTGSRIVTTGYKQPTPVTVVSEAQLQRDAKVSIGDAIRELPAVGASGSPSNGVGANNIVGGLTGLDYVNLRQLGFNRTLVLIDGQRVVQSNITGVVDLGTVPTMLVQRVDVVTGGASAAWGSDAVAGVVNLVLNKNFKGIRLSAEYGNVQEWDHRTYRLQGAVGTSFLDDRAHVSAAVNYLNADQAVFSNARKWNTYTNLLLNPAYTATNNEPRLIHVPNVGLSQATNGGLIYGPACAVAVVAGVCARPNTLVNTRFVGSSGATATFNPGLVSGAASSGGDAEHFYAATNDLAVAYHTLNAFGLGSYDVTDTLRASVQLNYGTSWTENNSTPSVRFGTLTIQRDNPYLPQSVVTQMTNLGLSSIQIGTSNINNIPFNAYSYNNFVQNGVGIPVSIQKRRLERGVVSLDGKIGSNWTWNAYYQQGRVRADIRTLSNLVTAKYNFAVDAVRDPATGNIVCRATLAGNAAAAGCVPLNVIGEGVASQAGIRYVNVAPGQNYEVIKLQQDVAAVSAQGKLPFGLAAGNVSMAVGGEYRREKGDITVDPGAAARSYAFANFSAFSGRYNVKEGFLELEVPLLDHVIVDSLALNAAGRVTNYSTSGTVETWKIGLTSQFNSLIRVRGTVSRDIRAPNLQELFSGGSPLGSNAIDPRTGQNVSIFSTTSGNPDLKPEKADTVTAGVVLSPARRLNLSLDFYSIKISDAIFSISTTVVLQRCNAGEASFCAQLDFNGPNGALSQIRTFPRNLSSQKVSGLDFQADHQWPALGGNLASRLIGTYTLVQKQTLLGVTTDYNGAIGVDSPVQGFPKLRATLTETFTKGPVSGTIQGRLIGKAKLVNAWSAKDVDNNNIKAAGYLDLRGSYQIGPAQLFFAIDNLLDRDPPNVAASYTNAASIFSTAVRGDIYDLLGRTYRAGVRLNF